jgi:hypothetical protein
MPKKRKAGRPTVYNPVEHPQVAEEAARNGTPLRELAKTLRVSVSTIKNWMAEHPVFLAAITQGREAAIDHVEHSLFERAIGYAAKATKVVVVSQGAGLPSKIEQVSIIENYPPDVAALKFFLCNRRPKQWRERSEVKLAGVDNLPARLAAARARVAKLTQPPLSERT